MILTKIQLKNWKNFGDVNATCGRRVFLIGPNASGKSNFLDALRFLREVTQDGLAKAVEARGGMKSVRYLCARRPPDVKIAVCIDNKWEYILSFSTEKGKSVPRITEERVFCNENGKRMQLLGRPTKEDRQDEERLTQTALQQVNANKDFRIIADYFKSIEYRHILPQLVRDPKGFSTSPVKNDPFGRDLVMQIWNTPPSTLKSRLKKINEALTIAVPQLSNLSVEQDKATGMPHLVVKYDHWRPYAGYQNEDSFSDGTLRLLALLWSIFAAKGPLLLEEPEVSLHNEIIRQLPGIFARLDQSRKKAIRQIFVTTHAEAMLSMPGIGANEVLRVEPGNEGSVIRTSDEVEIKLMEEGLSAADVLLPKTRPTNIEKLALWSMS